MSNYSFIMARPLDENRRASLLTAATRVFAEHGVSAPTSLITKQAKISEGSLFTYFKTKDELIAAVYVQIRQEAAVAIMTNFPVKGGIRERLEHVYRQFVTWGAENRNSRRALAQVQLSKAVTPQLRAKTQLLYSEVDRIQEDALAQKRLHVPAVMPGPAIAALGDMTMALIEQQPDQREKLMEAGFQMLWAALTSKP